MTDDRTFHPEPLDPNAMTRAQRIRAAADAELPLDSVSPDDLPRVEFERALRHAVRQSAPQTEAPAELRAKIEHLLASGADRRTDPVATPAISADTRRQSFWNRSSRWISVAAVLALCATMVVYAFRSGGSSFGADAGVVRAASFVRNETDACAEINDRFNTKFKARSKDDALDLARSMFVTMPDALLRADDALTSKGYRFAGFGRCAVPGPGKSAHLIYHADAGPQDAVSLFIQERGVSDAKEFTDGLCYLVPCEQTPRERVFVWREDGFVYYLFSHNTDAIAAARDAFDAPEREVAVTD